MKSVLVLLALLVSAPAFAERTECEQGENAIRFNKAYTCYDGRWILANPVILKCKEGSTQYFPVKGVYAGREEITALATCVNGKYKFANDAWNYKPTQGLNKCKEGSVWENGDTRAGRYETYQCINGKAVRIR